MTRVRFKATPEKPSHLHEKGGKKEVPHGKGTTWKVVPPVILRDGASVEMDDFDVSWCLAAYPDNFSVVETAKPRKSEDDA